jgi:hypothetical protein
LKPFRLLHGVEVNVRANGTLDVRTTLAGLDWVVRSIHAAFSTTPTERVLAVMETRMSTDRPPDRPEDQQAGADGRRPRARVRQGGRDGHGGGDRSQPDRLDLRDADARLAGERGCASSSRPTLTRSAR